MTTWSFWLLVPPQEFQSLFLSADLTDLDVTLNKLSGHSGQFTGHTDREKAPQLHLISCSSLSRLLTIYSWSANIIRTTSKFLKYSWWFLGWHVKVFILTVLVVFLSGSEKAVSAVWIKDKIRSEWRDRSIMFPSTTKLSFFKLKRYFMPRFPCDCIVRPFLLLLKASEAEISFWFDCKMYKKQNLPIK